MQISMAGSGTAGMNNKTIEDTDFNGLPPSSKSPEERAEEFLGEMTLDEKINFVGGYKSGNKGRAETGSPLRLVLRRHIRNQKFRSRNGFPFLYSHGRVMEPEAH